MHRKITFGFVVGGVCDRGVARERFLQAAVSGFFFKEKFLERSSARRRLNKCRRRVAEEADEGEHTTRRPARREDAAVHVSAVTSLSRSTRHGSCENADAERVAGIATNNTEKERFAGDTPSLERVSPLSAVGIFCFYFFLFKRQPDISS
jgi:hypothetical protein